MTIIERSAGRSTFGGDPEKYDWARPRYPAAIFQALQEVCGLRPGTRTPNTVRHCHQPRPFNLAI